MRTTGLAIGAMVLALVSCDGGGDGLSAPGTLVAYGPPDFLDFVSLAWTPVGGAERYELQGRLGLGAWETIEDQIPGDVVGGQLLFDPSAPEATAYTFRVRAARGGTTSGWSNEAQIFRGVRPAQGISAYEPGLGMGVMAVQWTQGSTQADAILLERALVTLDGSTGAWSALPGVALGDTSFTDTDLGGWVDGSRLAYRVTYSKNGYASAPANAVTRPAGPLAPVALAAAPAGASGILLTWTPRSGYADRQVVMRWSRSLWSELDVVELPPAASSYLDTLPAPGVYVYAVRSQVGPGWWDATTASQSDRVAGFTSLDPDAAFTVSSLSLPPGVQAARDSAGRFATVEWTTDADYQYVARAHLPDGAGWVTHDSLAGGGLQSPAILFDPRDRPHVFVATSSPPAAAQVRHDWLDASGWHTELLPPHRVSDLTIDAAGAIHAVSCDTALVYLTDASGSWTAETLTAPYLNGSCRVAAGPDGDPRIAYGAYVDTPDALEYRLAWLRREGEGWADEVVPGTDGVLMDAWHFYRVLAPSATRTALVFERSTVGAGSTVYAAVRDGGAWGAVEQVGERAFNGQQASYAAAAAPSGRVLVVWNGWPNGDVGAPGEAAVRAVDGGWTTLTLFDAPYAVAAGFSPSGKAWALEGAGPYALLYTER